MPTDKEIERRWIVYGLEEEGFAGPAKDILQGYLDIDGKKQTRIRIEDGMRAILGRKEGSGVERVQVEREIDLDEARAMLEGCDAYLRKRRHVRDGWEVDFVEDCGPVVAEKEMANRDEPVELPNWIPDAIEVTDWLTSLDLARIFSQRQAFGAPPKRLLRVVLLDDDAPRRIRSLKRLGQAFPTSLVVPEMPPDLEGNKVIDYMLLAENRGLELGKRFILTAAPSLAALSSYVAPHKAWKERSWGEDCPDIEALFESTFMALLLDLETREKFRDHWEQRERGYGKPVGVAPDYTAWGMVGVHYLDSATATEQMFVWAVRNIISQPKFHPDTKIIPPFG